MGARLSGTKIWSDKLSVGSPVLNITNFVVSNENYSAYNSALSKAGKGVKAINGNAPMTIVPVNKLLNGIQISTSKFLNATFTGSDDGFAISDSNYIEYNVGTSVLTTPNSPFIITKSQMKNGNTIRLTTFSINGHSDIYSIKFVSDNSFVWLASNAGPGKIYSFIIDSITAY